MVMKKKILLFSFLFLNFLLAGIISAVYYLGSCGDLNTPGQTYILQNDVTSLGVYTPNCRFDPARPPGSQFVCIYYWTDYCFTITANDITLDLGGHTITGKYGETCNTGSCTGVSVSGYNSKVLNGNIQSFKYAVYLSSSNNVFTALNIYGTSYGVYFYSQSMNNVFYNNRFVTGGIFGSYTNYFNNAEKGNYWTNPSGTGFSDTCADADYNGFCDYPYSVGGYTDSLPISRYAISSCGILNSPGRTYVLSDDITTNQDCFTITADGVTLNLNGHTITGNGQVDGITVNNADNVMIKNGNINNFYYNVLLSSSTNGSVNDVQINGGNYGIHASASSFGNYDNVVIDSTMYGLSSSSSSNGVFNDLTIQNSASDGVVFYSSSNNNFVNVNSNGNIGDGFKFYSNSDLNVFTNVVSNNNGASGFEFLSGSDLNIFTNVTSNNNGGSGFSFSSSSGNTFSGCVSNDNGADGFGFLSCLNNHFSNLTSINNNYGVFLRASSNNVLDALNIYGNSRGIYLLGNSDSNIINDSYMEENDYGLYFDYEMGSPEYNLIYNNYFNNSDNYFSSGNYVNYFNVSLVSGTNIIGENYIGGNYWALVSGYGSSQICIDINSNGICDLIYDIGDGNYDNLPLTYIGRFVCEGDSYFQDGLCVSPKAYWGYANGDEILSETVSVNADVTNIRLVLETNPLLNGTEVSFIVKEKKLLLDKPIRTFNSIVGADGTASIVWNITQEDLDNIDLNNEVYFEVGGDGIDLSSGEILFTLIDCGIINICSDYATYMGESECSADSCGIADDNCPEGSLCECVWNSNMSSCNFNSYGGVQTSCGDGLINQGEQCDSNNFAGVTCTSFGYSGGQISCNAPGSVNECYFNVSGCTGLTEGVCGDGVINQGEQCDSANIFSGSGACNFFDSYNDDYSVFCDNCLVNVSSCIGGIGKVFGVGNCVYEQNTNDDCEDGYLTYTSVGVWAWDVMNSFDYDGGENFVYDDSDGMWHYDPNGLAESCREEIPMQTVQCPAQVQLSFFSVYSAVFIVILLILVYWILIKKNVLKFLGMKNKKSKKKISKKR